MYHFTRHTTTDRDVNQVQDNVQRFTEELSIIAKGRLVRDVYITNAAEGSVIPHKLGRKPVGRFVVLGTYPLLMDVRPPDETNLYLQLNIAGTVSLWVF
jgi:hypothetical protein